MASLKPEGSGRLGNPGMIAVSIILTALLVGGAVYWWQKKEVESGQNNLREDVAGLQMELLKIKERKAALEKTRQEMEEANTFLKKELVAIKEAKEQQERRQEKDIKVLEQELQFMEYLRKEGLKELMEIEPILKRELPEWMNALGKTLPDASLSSFIKISHYKWERSDISDDTNSDLTRCWEFNPEDEDWKCWRRDICIYSPDRTRCIEYPFIVGPVDAELYMVDFTRNTVCQIAYGGATGSYHEALWLDNDSFVIVGQSAFRFYIEISRLNESITYIGPWMDTGNFYNNYEKRAIWDEGECDRVMFIKKLETALAKHAPNWIEKWNQLVPEFDITSFQKKFDRKIENLGEWDLDLTYSDKEYMKSFCKHYPCSPDKEKAVTGVYYYKQGDDCNNLDLADLEKNRGRQLTVCMGDSWYEGAVWLDNSSFVALRHWPVYPSQNGSSGMSPGLEYFNLDENRHVLYKGPTVDSEDWVRVFLGGDSSKILGNLPP